MSMDCVSQLDKHLWKRKETIGSLRMNRHHFPLLLLVVVLVQNYVCLLWQINYSVDGQIYWVTWKWSLILTSEHFCKKGVFLRLQLLLKGVECVNIFCTSDKITVTAEMKEIKEKNSTFMKTFRVGEFKLQVQGLWEWITVANLKGPITLFKSSIYNKTMTEEYFMHDSKDVYSCKPKVCFYLPSSPSNCFG